MRRSQASFRIHQLLNHPSSKDQKQGSFIISARVSFTTFCSNLSSGLNCWVQSHTGFEPVTSANKVSCSTFAAKDDDNGGAPIADKDNDKPLADNIKNKYAKGHDDNMYAKGKDNNKNDRGDGDDKYAEGNDGNKNAKDNIDAEPLNNNNDNGYAKEGNLTKGNGHDEPLAGGKDNDKYTKGDNNDKY